MAMERLDKILAGTGRWSRKEVRELAKLGRVEVNGQVVRRPDDKFDRTAMEVRVDGEPVSPEPYYYLMLHKPAGLLSVTEDPRQPTVLSLLPPHLRRVGLFPVGRLDKDTEGLLLLTNDGPLAHRLLAPKRHVDKVYYVEVDGILDQQDVEAVSQGIVLRDGYQCLPGKLELLEGNTSAYITIREGKYHQIKRMMAARGKPVSYLKRIRFGPLQLDPQLDKGGWRALTQEELQELFRQ